MIRLSDIAKFTKNTVTVVRFDENGELVEEETK